MPIVKEEGFYAENRVGSQFCKIMYNYLLSSMSGIKIHSLCKLHWSKSNSSNPSISYSKNTLLRPGFINY